MGGMILSFKRRVTKAKFYAAYYMLCELIQWDLQDKCNTLHMKLPLICFWKTKKEPSG